MLQLKNNSPFAATMALFPNEDGVDTLYVVVKATFNIAKEFTLSDTQHQPFVADEYWGEPGKSSVKYGSDMHIGKLATDIIMVGSACAPNQKEVRNLDVSLTVGKISKSVRVFGDRHWQDGKITAPAPFKTMAMVYENAYGGTQLYNGQIDAAETRNPVGRGLAGRRKTEEMNGVLLPNLEDPAQLIREYTDKPVPACFGVSAPYWHPRAGFAGTYDETWQKTRAPYLPKDFDMRFLNMAHPDLIYPGFLQGGEQVEIAGMHPKGVVQFDVPKVNLATHVTMADKNEQPEFNLETLMLEPNQLRVSMVWRAALQCDKKMLKISEIKIGLVK